MVHLDEPYLTIHWDQDIRAVWMEWKSPAVATSEQFRRVQNAGIELLRQKGTHKWIADIRNLGPITPADAKFSSDDWFPRALAAGMRWMALVVPKKIVTKMTMKLTMNKVQDTRLVTAYFDELEEARAWLRVQR
jgi:hypothetical protein